MSYTAVRGEFGYFYRGYYIERCPGNQWNIYPGGMGESRHSELAIAYGDCIAEGLRSLYEAKAEIDSYHEGK